MTQDNGKSFFDLSLWYEDNPESINNPVKLFADHGLELDITCGACPEQYDVFKEGTENQVAYLRLRHGWFRVDVPECGGEMIYEAYPEGDGMFDPDERMKYLSEALQAILKHYNPTPHA